jgi:formylglycine-generating enzyme required for sulfatase activity
MAEEDKKKSFWETLPGIITAIGVLLGGLTGVAALVDALNSGAKESTPKAEPLAVVHAAPAVLTANDAVEKRAAELERQLASAKEKAQQEADAAKAEAERVKAEAAEAKARAVELEKKLAESGKATAAEQLKVETAKPAPQAVAVEPKQGDTMIDKVTGMVLVYIPGGCFMMGQTDEEKWLLVAELGLHGYQEGYLGEVPMHKVCVNSFWMGKYEVTQRQWKNVMGANPSAFDNDDNNPVDRVSWNNAQNFINTLNKFIGKAYRLPTEAEWEYACRAKGSGRYCGGDDLDAVAWHKGNSGDTTHAVGGKQVNGFGLYDMSGNVWEWCADWYDSGYYASSPQSNPLGPESGSNRVIRGGSWGNSPLLVRTAYRSGFTPDYRGSSLGFRLVLSGQ